MTRVANFCPKCGAALSPDSLFDDLHPKCTQCGHIIFFDPKVAVVIVIQREATILLVKRGMDPGKGRWALPAGFIDAGEEPLEAARREVLEETGLAVRIDQLIDVLPGDDEGLADILIAYSASVLDGDLQANDDADEVGWFDKDNLPELVFATTDILIESWIRGTLDGESKL